MPSNASSFAKATEDKEAAAGKGRDEAIDEGWWEGRSAPVCVGSAQSPAKGILALPLPSEILG